MDTEKQARRLPSALSLSGTGLSGSPAGGGVGGREHRTEASHQTACPSASGLVYQTVDALERVTSPEYGLLAVKAGQSMAS